MLDIRKSGARNMHCKYRNQMQYAAYFGTTKNTDKFERVYKGKSTPKKMGAKLYCCLFKGMCMWYTL